MRRRTHLISSAIMSIFVLAAAQTDVEAAPFELNNGPGDGSVRVGVDGFGAFGSATSGDTFDAFYNPVGEIGEAGTTYESFLAIGYGDPAGSLASRQFLTSDELANPSVSGNNLSASSSFSVSDLQFTLNQSLTESFEDGMRTGSVLTQNYTVQNTSSQPQNFDIVRYLDGDLDFDGTISDGGGRIQLSGSEVLFETDAGTSAEQATTFVGITANGGTRPETNRFEVSEFSELRNKIENGGALNDGVQNDTDGDQFVDEAFDVTLALRNQFSLEPGESDTYQTQTLFGNAVPTEPGSTETLPLLPEEDEAPFVFEVEQPGDQTIWFDPPVAVGYEYQLGSGPLDFQSATLPTTVQSDPFEILVFDGTQFVSQGMFNPGDSFTFGSGVDMFRVTGIDPALGLDPNDPTAFPLGISFSGAGTVNLTISPITQVQEVPVPNTLLVLLAGLIVLVPTAARRKHGFHG